jgi:phosphoribosylamine--glycine ligase / phosphoribosylformylglycinamidine cyclo-ligase
VQLGFKSGYSVTVVAVAGGYPGTYAKNFFITLYPPLESITLSRLRSDLDSLIFHAGTKIGERTGLLMTNGGRVFAVNATAGDLRSAVSRAYEAIKSVKFSLMHYRKDIGHRL